MEYFLDFIVYRGIWMICNNKYHLEEQENNFDIVFFCKPYFI